MNIALDVMGGDRGPGEAIAGAVEAAREYNVTVSLVGRPEVIRAELAKHSTTGLNLPIVEATEMIEMHEKPANAVRAKPNSSIVVASRLVREGKANAFVSAGNTGAALAAGIFHIGRIQGILRPALTAPMPTRHGWCVLLDIGANVDVRPEHLQQFAVMGSIYARELMGVANPRVGLLSNGEEAGKGNHLVVSSYELLANAPGINFYGNVESKDVFADQVDVVVTDGFTGNIFVKTIEATARNLQSAMKEELTAGPISTVGAFLAQAALRRLRHRLDDSEHGGAVLLGLSGMAIVAHGRSNVTAFRHAIRIAKQGSNQDIPGKILAGIQRAAQAGAQSPDSSSLRTVPA